MSRDKYRCGRWWWGALGAEHIRSDGPSSGTLSSWTLWGHLHTKELPPFSLCQLLAWSSISLAQKSSLEDQEVHMCKYLQGQIILIWWLCFQKLSHPKCGVNQRRIPHPYFLKTNCEGKSMSRGEHSNLASGLGSAAKQQEITNSLLSGPPFLCSGPNLHELTNSSHGWAVL